MRRLLLMTFVLALGAGVALAQELPGGRIGIFSDNTGTNCAITDAAGLLPVYVVQVLTTGATACQYKAPKPACFTGSYLSDTNPFPVTLGNSQVGVSIGYGTCRTGAVHVQTIQYFALGTTLPCCFYKVECDPLGVDQCASGLIDIVDCSSNSALAKAQTGVFNANSTCLCVDIVPAQDSSWGQIKALYGE